MDKSSKNNNPNLFNNIMKRKMGIIGKTDENPKKKPRLVMYPPVIGILPPPTRPQKEILEVSEDQLGRSRLSSADDESRMITKSVLKTEFEREKGSQEELPSEQLASIMKMFKISLLNKIPIAQDKVIQVNNIYVFIYIYIYMVLGACNPSEKEAKQSITKYHAANWFPIENFEIFLGQKLERE